MVIYKQPGEYVKEGEPVAEVDSKKMIVDIPAPVSGIIKEFFANVEDELEVGANFYSIDTDGKPEDGISAAEASVPEPKKNEAPAAAPPK